MEIPNDTPKKQKRLTSVVWNHFERIRKGEACFAVCVHCNKKLSGSSNSGTTHLRNHLMRCLKRSNFDVSQLLAVKRRKQDNTVTISSLGGYDEAVNHPGITKFDHDQHKRDELVGFATGGKFDQERSRSDLARMIIQHGYPLSMVDHVGFRVFVRNLQPFFEFVPSSDVESSCLEIYQRERQKVFESISRFHGRINLSVEMWTSKENTEYMCLTAHYIDELWRLKKKILNFVTLDSSHTKDLLADVIVKCLTDWDIGGKVFALTFDDISIDSEIVLRIKDQISQNRTILGRQLFDVRSAVHVLNSIAQDSIEALKESIQKIRASIDLVKSSQVMLGKFNEIAQQVGIVGQRNLVLDSPSRWDSTHAMLEMALEYRAAFSLLQDHDPTYAASSLTESEWEFVASITSYLRLFAEIINAVMGNRCPTANIFFPEMCDVHVRLIEWCKSSDDLVNSIAIKMKVEFDQYWRKCSLPLAMAAILDPRFKMKLVEYYYSQIYGITALDRIKDVSDGIKRLFNAYTIRSTMVDDDNVTSSLPGNNIGLSTSNEPRDRLKGFDKFLDETSQSQNSVSDLDKYLEEPVFPRNCDFNLLNWWKVHTPRYPVLSMMARDLLGTPMSTISSELAFSSGGSGGRMLDQSRSSLSPETLQALICTQDWLRTEPLDLTPLAIHSARPILIESQPN